MENRVALLTEAIRRLPDQAAVSARLREMLAPLIAYDARTGADLVTTLRAYVECGGHAAATADRLFLHRNSVGYRLQRIQELAGIDARDRSARLVLLVAFALTDPSFLQTAAHGEHAHEDQRPQ